MPLFDDLEFELEQEQEQEQEQENKQEQEQEQWQFALNKSFNENDNKNENENDNKLDNKVDNEVDNKVDNEVDNKVDNKVENKVDNKVDVKVDVEVDASLGLEGHMPSDDDLIDIEEIKFEDDLDGLFGINAQDVYQDVHGNGNDAAFNMQQVNALVDNDEAKDIWIKAENDAFKDEFEMEAKGGNAEAKAEDIEAKIDDAGSIAETGVATADASINQEAFTQNITQGANIQFNEVSIRNVGDDMEDSVIL